MKPTPRTQRAPARIARQRGVALFFALICLVAIMMAAVILVRSVDTSTLIAGNLAFQQSATRSGDSGNEAAIAYLNAVQVASVTKNVLLDPSHPFNNDAAAQGYYASLDPTKSLTSTAGNHFNWNNTDSVGLAADATGNTVRYIIQRMCRTSGVAAGSADCLYSGATLDNNGQNIPLPQDVCNGPGCPAAGQTPEIRITSKVTGPKNATSYVQAIVY